MVMKAENFSVLAAGVMKEWAKAKIRLPGGNAVAGKRFIKELIDSTGCEISLNSLPPGRSVPFFHAHKENEEIYIFLAGHGEMQVDGKIFQVSEGTVVRIAPEGMRCVRNTGQDELVAIVIQAREGSLQQHTKDDGIIPETPVAWVAA